MEIIGSVLLMGLLMFLASKILTYVSFVIHMLNSDYRKTYFNYREKCKKLKLTGDLNLLKQFSPENTNKKRKYHLYYNNSSRIDGDELYHTKYENDREFYVKVIETVDKYYLNNCFKNSLKSIKTSNKFLIKYLVDEIDKISDDYMDDSINKRTKVLKSRIRFINYLIVSKNYIENEQYLKTLLENIIIKVKKQ